MENLTNAIIQSGFTKSPLDLPTGQFMIVKQCARHCENSSHQLVIHSGYWLLFCFFLLYPWSIDCDCASLLPLRCDTSHQHSETNYPLWTSKNQQHWRLRCCLTPVARTSKVSASPALSSHQPIWTQLIRLPRWRWPLAIQLYRSSTHPLRYSRWNQSMKTSLPASTAIASSGATSESAEAYRFDTCHEAQTLINSL